MVADMGLATGRIGGQLLGAQGVVHAALAGHGIALGRLALIAPMLADKRLATVGGQPADATEHAYWLVRNARRSTPDAEIVTRWLVRQAATTAQLLTADSGR